MNLLLSKKIFFPLVLFIYLSSLLLFWSHFNFNPTASIYASQEISSGLPAFSSKGLVILDGEAGFDGQYYYHVAQNPKMAAKSVPLVWLQRVAYPLLASFLSFGQSSAIPIMMVAVNLASLVLAAYFLLKLLLFKNINPLFVFVWILNAGIIISLSFNLTEPLMFLFLIMGYYFIEAKSDFLWGSILFSGAILARELSIFFIIPVLAYYFIKQKGRGKYFLLIPLAVFISWQTLFRIQYGVFPILFTSGQSVLPFTGVWGYLKNINFNLSFTDEGVRQISSLPIVALFLYQSFISLFIFAKNRSIDNIFSLCLIFQILLFSMLSTTNLNSGIGNCGRYATGLVLFSILCFRVEDRKYLYPLFLGIVITGFAYLTAMFLFLNATYYIG